MEAVISATAAAVLEHDAVVPATSLAVQFLGVLGSLLALGLAVIGSSLGISVAGQAAAGGWAREGKENKALSFPYIILMGLPLSQTIYGFVLLMLMKPHFGPGMTLSEASMLAALGLACGLAQLFSAWGQGKICAAGIRCLLESGGKGFANILIAAGVIETVGIFGMVFCILLLPK
jgi:V/A-type H+-transporting ATPase subunit K